MTAFTSSSGTIDTINKKTIRVGFIDYYKPIDEFFINMLNEYYDVIRDDQNPEYLFFCDETFGIENKKWKTGSNKRPIKIFFTGENRRPFNYDADFFISFDHINDPRHFRLPLYWVENWVQIKYMDIPDVRHIQRGQPRINLGFCSFVSSNPNSHERNSIFKKLCEYKKVDSGGAFLNNIGYMLPRTGVDAQLSKFGFIATRKFNLCYENSSYPGYVTEKLFHALYMGAIPIYWGSPTVNLDFNPKAFINRVNYNSDKEMIDHIIDIDKQGSEDMLKEPILSPVNDFHYSKLKKWFREVVIQ